MWIKTTEDKQEVYCKVTNKVTKEELLKEIDSLKASLTAIPEPPTDKELLEWAKSNYPYFNREAERQTLQDRLEEINKILEVE